MSFDKDGAAQRWRFVEYLRALAMLAVAAFHCEPHLNVILGREPYAPAIVNWFGFGGVDLFFIISGFVVWPATWKHAHFHTRDNFSFLLRRLLRVYMPYWVVLAGVCALGFVGAAADLVKSALLFPQPIARQVLPVAWTLVLEVIFYGITFLLLFLPRHVRFTALCGIVAVALLGNLVPVATGVVDSTQVHKVWSWVPTAGWFGPVVAKYVFSLHLLQFAIGAGIAELARRGALKKLAPYRHVLWLAASMAFCAAVAAAMLLADERVATDIRIVLQRFAIATGTTALIFLATVCTEAALPRRRGGALDAALVWFGAGSYMVYLLHNVALEFAVAYGLRDWCASLGVSGAATFAAWFVAMIALAAWIGNRIELPLYHRLVALLGPKPERREDAPILSR